MREQLKEIKEYPEYDNELQMRVARTYLKLHRYWEALVLYRNVYERDPKHELAGKGQRRIGGEEHQVRCRRRIRGRAQ